MLLNDKNMVMFCKDFHTKEMEEVPLIWFDLKYFLKQSYTNAFDKMEIFNLKENQFNYKGNQCAVLTGTYNKQIVSWYNGKTPYPKIILDKTKNKLIENGKNYKTNLLTLQYNPPKIWNQHESAWAIITNERNVLTGGIKEHGGDSSSVQ
jgi:hypothetical protein